VKAIGITNQRETTLVWRRSTGKPCFNAIVWLDTRTRCVFLFASSASARYSLCCLFDIRLWMQCTLSKTLSSAICATTLFYITEHESNAKRSVHGD
jgi:hypothetical protein